MPEVRRVQKLGKSTLMVSLPAEWVKNMGLRPGDAVNIEVFDDGSLRISPLGLLSKRYERHIEIIVSRNSNESLLTRSVYASYLLGHDKIDIKSVDEILSETQLRAVRDAVRSLIGAEIVEHTPNKISIQILIDPSKYSALTLLGRMANIVKFMIQHIITSINDRQIHLLKEVIELESELDRLYALTVRQLVLSQSDRSLIRYLGIRPPLVTEYRSIVKSLEDVGDALAQIASLLIEAGEGVLEKVSLHLDMLKECTDTLLLIVERVLKILEDPDPYLANGVLNLIGEFNTHLSKYNLIIFKTLGLDESYLIVRDLIDRLNIVSKGLEAIAEIAFDISMEGVEARIDITRAYL